MNSSLQNKRTIIFVVNVIYDVLRCSIRWLVNWCCVESCHRSLVPTDFPENKTLGQFDRHSGFKWMQQNKSRFKSPRFHTLVSCLHHGACFSRVPKLFRPISSATIPFISSQQRGSKPSNFATLLLFLHYQHVERSVFENKRIAGWQLVFRARKVLGTLEKLAPGEVWSSSMPLRTRTSQHLVLLIRCKQVLNWLSPDRRNGLAEFGTRFREPTTGTRSNTR